MLSAVSYLPFIADDALITLHYVSRFLEGLGLTWNNDVPVEGYSNLLWAILISILGFLGLDLIIAVRLLGFLFSISSLYLIANYTFMNHKKSLLLVPIVVLILFSSSTVISVWTIAGLEQPLFCFLVLLSILNYLKYRDTGHLKYLWITSLALGLVSITRPDGLLFAFIIASYHLLNQNGSAKKQKLNDILRLSTFPILIFSAQLIFRVVYYNEIVPNTALVKISPSIPHFIDGIYYNLRFIKSNISLFILAIISIIACLKYNRKNIFFYIFTLSIWLLYISFIGGDIFVAFRHHYITILILLLTITDGLKELFSAIKAKKSRLIISFAVLLLVLTHIYQQITNVNYTVVRLLNWHWETKTLSDELKIYFANQQPLIAVDAAGSLPYWTGFPAIDMLGLNDYHIARNKNSKIGSGQIGHELGDDEYIMNKNPDIIQIHISYKVPIHYADSLLFRNNRFLANYYPVRLKANGEYPYKGVLWFNKNSKLVGLDSNESRMIIPTYLLKSSNKVYSEFSISHRLVTPISSQDTLSYEVNGIIDISQITIKPKNNDLDIKVKHYDNSTTFYLTNNSDKLQFIEKVIIKY